MTLLIPLMLFGWIPFSIILFNTQNAHRAVLYIVIGGWLFLPVSGYDLPGLPAFTKNSAIALGLILGGRLSGKRRASNFAWKVYDIPMLAWCLCPLPTSLLNGLGGYDGFSCVWNQTMIWGIPYLSGRVYFDSMDKVHDLCVGIVIGCLVYIPLCMFEMKMSPKLSKEIYGFFPHSWRQHQRYGGWRPIVFMQHGLMVALWMASSTTVVFWYWRDRIIRSISGVPMSFIVILAIITTILCKSANGWIFLILGCLSFSFRNKPNIIFLLSTFVPLYLGVRIGGVLTGRTVEMFASIFFDAKRVASLSYRLNAEDLFLEKTMERFIFGWGGYSRGWPIDPDTGERLVSYVDSLWIIAINSYGFVGLFSLVISMFIGPWLVLKFIKKHTKDDSLKTLPPTVLSVIVSMFMIDCLVNGMINPVYVLISGVLVSCSLFLKNDKKKSLL